MIYKILPLIAFFLMSHSAADVKVTKSSILASNTVSSFDMKAESIYNALNANNFSLPKSESFKKALEGFYALKQKGMVQKEILTIVDFSISSNKKS